MDNKPNTPAQEANLTLRALCAWTGFIQLRECDTQVVDMLAQRVDTLEEAQRVAVNYFWDHLLGEPDEVTEDQLLQAYLAMKAAFLG